VPDQWWRDAVVYQVYLRSFADGNGDGIGDLTGLRARLQYLAGLGIDAIWVNLWYPSPMVDGGYDVTDYRAIDPCSAPWPRPKPLIQEAHRHGLRVLADIVPNHTSDRHPWFQAALAGGPGSHPRQRSIFRPGRGDDGHLATDAMAVRVVEAIQERLTIAVRVAQNTQADRQGTRRVFRHLPDDERPENFLYHVQGRPCGRPPAAAVPGRHDTAVAEHPASPSRHGEPEPSAGRWRCRGRTRPGQVAAGTPPVAAGCGRLGGRAALDCRRRQELGGSSHTAVRSGPSVQGS
jgi:Alpha amylase, catalytic domain